ncbi:MAG: nucleotidyltransferase family protein [Nanoarchaeota archaeon]
MTKTAIILAGGLGTRLKPLTDKIPKPLVPIGNKPLLQHIIENFRKYGIKNIILSVGYKAEQIEEYFGDGSKFGVKISYSTESLPLGTGGAIKKAAEGLTAPFFLQWGDNLMDIDWEKVEKEFFQSKNSIIMTLTPREDVENFGVARLEGKKILSFVEKPKREDAPSNLINAGAFMIDPLLLEMLPKGTSSIEKDCFEKIASQGKITAYLHHGQWFPTDAMEKYLIATEKFQSL